MGSVVFLLLFLNIPFWDDVVYLYEFRAEDSMYSETQVVHCIQKDLIPIRK